MRTLPGKNTLFFGLNVAVAAVVFFCAALLWAIYRHYLYDPATAWAYMAVAALYGVIMAAGAIGWIAGHRIQGLRMMIGANGIAVLTILSIGIFGYWF